MFDSTSRYASIEDATIELPDGRTATYKRRRFLPHARELQPLGEETVQPGDRIDLVANRTIGDPEQFWRVCDANDAVDPEALIEPGRRLTISGPRP
jgi:hypothetical protein